MVALVLIVLLGLVAGVWAACSELVRGSLVRNELMQRDERDDRGGDEAVLTSLNEVTIASYGVRTRIDIRNREMLLVSGSASGASPVRIHWTALASTAQHIECGRAADSRSLSPYASSASCDTLPAAGGGTLFVHGNLVSPVERVLPDTAGEQTIVVLGDVLLSKGVRRAGLGDSPITIIAAGSITIGALRAGPSPREMFLHSLAGSVTLPATAVPESSCGRYVDGGVRLHVAAFAVRLGNSSYSPGACTTVPQHPLPEQKTWSIIAESRRN